MKFGKHRGWLGAVAVVGGAALVAAIAGVGGVLDQGDDTGRSTTAAGGKGAKSTRCSARGNTYPGPPKEQDATAVASWKQRPSSERQLRKASKLIVHAQVVSVKPGAPLVASDVSPEEAEHTAVPTRDVELVVCERLAGQGGDKVTVIQVGAEGVTLEDDPAYTVGQQYVMYLDRYTDGAGRATGRLLPVAPDGRLYVRGDGKLQRVTRDRSIKGLEGRPLPEVAKAIKGGTA